MLEPSLKRTYKFRSFFVVGLLVFAGFLSITNLVQADSWAGTEAGRASVPTPTTQATDGAKSNDTQPKNSGDTSSSCGFTGAVTDPVKCLLVPALNGLTTVMQWLASGAAVMFVWIVNPDNISGANGLLNKGSVYELWKFIRDFFNLFFILILLLSAFATVFQVENFSIRKIFLNVLIAALIINFSFPITRFLIDLTNVPMYYFLNAILPGANGNEAFTRIFLASTGMGGIAVASQTEFIPAFTSFIFMFLFTISLLVLAVLFLVRVIALTLLLVFSPFGFAATLMPGFQDLGRQWWSKFWNYAFFGPAAALMLLVAMRFQNQLATDSTLASFNKVSTSMTAGEAAGNSISLVAFYIIPLVLIWAAIGMANKFSIAGADKVTGMGYTAARWAGRKAGRVVAAPVVGGAKFAGRKYEKFMTTGEKAKFTKFLAPTALWKGYKASREEQVHKDEQPVKLAAAKIQDDINNVTSRVVNTINPNNWRPKNWKKLGANTEHTDHAFDESERQKHEHVKEIEATSSRGDHVIGELESAIESKNVAQARAALTILAKNNDLNDMLIRLGDEYGKGKVVSSDNAREVLKNIFEKVGVTDEEEIAKSLMVLSDTALASGNYAFGGLATYNSKEHKFVLSDAAQQAGQVGGKFGNLEPQDQARKLHPDALFTRHAVKDPTVPGGYKIADPSTGELEVEFGDMNGDAAAEVIKKITTATADQSNRSRTDTQRALINAYDSVVNKGRKADFPNFVANYNSNSNFRYYVTKMAEQNGYIAKGGTLPSSI